MAEQPPKPPKGKWPDFVIEPSPPPTPGAAPDPNAPLHNAVAFPAMVGTIATMWSLLERSIDNALWIFAGITEPRVGVCLTSQIQSVRAKLIALEALANLRGAPEAAIKAIRRFQNETESPSRKRDMVVHNPMFGDNNGNMYLARYSGDRKAVDEIAPIKGVELMTIRRDIEGLLSKFGLLMNQHLLPLRPPSSDMPPPPPVSTPPDHPPEAQSP